MGWKRNPTISWSQMSLKDEAAEKRIVMDLLDRKVISAESALTFLGFDNEVEMRRKLREMREAEKSGLPHSVGPFEQAVQVQQGKDPGSRGADLGEKDLEVRKEDLAEKRKIMKEKPAPGQTGPSRGPGRPNNKGDESSRRQKKQREARVTATLETSALENGAKNREKVENWWKPRYLEAVQKDNLRQLTADEKSVYNDCVLAIYSRIPLYSTVSEEMIARAAEEVMEGGVYVNALFNEVRHDLIEAFREQNGRKPITREMKQLENKAYILYRQSQ
jgi:hypothetical protein